MPCCGRQESVTTLGYIQLTISSKPAISLPQGSRLASIERSTMGVSWLVSLWQCWRGKPSISMVHRAMSTAILCLITCCNGRPYAGPKDREQCSTTSGAFLRQKAQERLWQASIASSAAGVVKQCALSAAMSTRIVPWRCAWPENSYLPDMQDTLLMQHE